MGIYFIYISLKRLYCSTSAHVCYIKIHAEMRCRDIAGYRLQFLYSLVAMLFDMLFHIFSLNIYTI